MKHAYLIMAHNNFYILEKLIKLLDSEFCDIYLHIDKKANNFPFKKFKNMVTKSQIFFTQRTNVSWGSYSQINCELTLLKAAVKNQYSYYHLISGVDLPLKSQNEINNFFLKHQGKEFIHFVPLISANDVLNRIKIYYPLQKFGRSFKNNFVAKGFYVFRKLIEKFQHVLKVNRLKNADFEIRFGPQWFSITNDLAKYVINCEDLIKKYFKSSLCADELFLQTLVYNSKFKNNLYYQKEDMSYLGCLRKIDWTKEDCKNGSPHTWRNSDFNELVSSDYLFARKFDYSTDKKIIDKIFNYVANK